MTDDMKNEAQMWQALCARLLVAGAVTMADLQSDASDTSTPGLKLIASIREWARSYVGVGGVETDAERRQMVAAALPILSGDALARVRDVVSEVVWAEVNKSPDLVP